MNVIIPMSGQGSRFRSAGYETIKPLIKVGKKSMIEWVVEMFPRNTRFHFICDENHEREFGLISFLKKLNIEKKIYEIERHKHGPVFAVSMAKIDMDPKDRVLISYCDYFIRWNYYDFEKYINENRFDGVIPCYTGFHPHLIPEKNLYASCLIDGEKVLQIREKFSFNENKMLAYHSPGLYYFKDFNTYKIYAERLLNSENSINNEYYTSMVYSEMLNDQKSIGIYRDIQHFCQWGTPEDLQDFLIWMKILNKDI